jgi:two-component system KDP operon response regulator KdpE
MSAAPRILVIDDERPIRRFLKTGLQAFGYVVVEAENGEEGLRRSALERPELVVLDLALPDLDGVQVLRRLREWSSVPVIVLSARSAETAKIEALDAGADDYVTKPFGIGELTARMRAALRRRLAEEMPQPVVSLGPVRVDLAARRVTLAEEPVRLSPKEYDLLRLFVVNAGKLLTHKQILREIWPATSSLDVQNLRVLVGQLRRKVEPDPAVPRYIRSEPGIGYRLETEDTAA